MKTWLITLSLLCAVTPAMADDMSPAPAKGQPEAAMATEATVSAEPAKTMHHRTKRLPRGDLRKCLDLKDNAAIIRCAETGRKK